MNRRLARRVVSAAECLLFSKTAARLELLAASVGKGDALLLRAGECVCLIDAGKAEAWERLSRVFERCGIGALDAVFLTHTDRDHAGGLKRLRKSGVEIRAIYASRWHPEVKDKKHPAVKAARKLGLDVRWLGAGDEVALGDAGAVLRVVAPIRAIAGNDDDNSLVMLLDAPDGRILFTGDMEEDEEALLLASGAELRCDVLKVPNHGGSDACSAALIGACAPKVAVISTDSAEKPDTPDKRVLDDLDRAGCVTYVTENCTLGVRVVLEEGRVTADYVNW